MGVEVNGTDIRPLEKPLALAAVTSATVYC